MHIAVGSDHRGLELKQSIMKMLAETEYSYKDFGCYTDDSVDYPDIAREVAGAVASGDFDRGILICGTGTGMCIAANKFRGIRAASCYNAFCARRARQHNDANVLCMGSETVQGSISEIVDVFLATEFEEGRHLRRMDKIRAMEG